MEVSRAHCPKPTQREPQPDEFANYLGDVFGPHAGRHTPVLDMFKGFTLSHASTASHPSNYLEYPEVEHVLSPIHCNKDDETAGGDGVVVETLQYGQTDLDTCLFESAQQHADKRLFRRILAKHTLLTTLPETRGTWQPICWRRMAVLEISYVICKLTCVRLRNNLVTNRVYAWNLC